jgi:DNA-binding MurR/RpiR family transcriptional regulator
MTDFVSIEAPRDFAALKDLIAARAASMPRRLAQIAAFALDNPDDVAFGTVASLSQKAYVQPSALVRFAQSLGYEGFSDLQDVFRNRLRERILNYDERIDQLRRDAGADASPLLIFDGFSKAATNSLAQLTNRLDPEKLATAVSKLASAETIFLIGLRRSFPITTYMSYAFGKLGVRNVLVNAVGGLAQEDVSFATTKDCVLAISFRPYASETVALATQAAEAGVPVVAITDSVFSPLSPLAEVWLEVEEAAYEGFRSLAATMALAMSLTVAVAERRAKPRGTA